jgi:hypothetical protein
MAKEVSRVSEEEVATDAEYAEYAEESLEIAEASLEIFSHVEPEPESEPEVVAAVTVANPVRVKASSVNVMPMARSVRRP